MSLGISTRRFFRVSLTSVRSVFMEVDGQQSTVNSRRSTVSGSQVCVDTLSTANCELFTLLVRKGGVEPPKPFGYRILSPARLPVPPLSRSADPYATIRRQN